MNIIERKRELLTIYKKLLFCKTSEEVMNLYVEYLKIMVNAPLCNDYFGNKIGNCYTYALGFICPDLFNISSKILSGGPININVGFISSDKKSTVRVKSEKEVLDNFNADCEVLKIKVFNSGVNSNFKHNGYKVFVFIPNDIEKSGDFHFVRQNYDGKLFHKNGYLGEVVRLDSLKEINEEYRLVKTLELVRPNRGR